MPGDHAAIITGAVSRRDSLCRGVGNPSVRSLPHHQEGASAPVRL